jgi:hypothetical protein
MATKSLTVDMALKWRLNSENGMLFAHMVDVYGTSSENPVEQ